MSVLKKSQRVFKGINLIGNFIERPLRLGDIVLNDDGQHMIYGNIEDFTDGFSLKGKTETSNKSDLKYTSESNIDVTIGGSANTTVAKGEIELKFNSKNSAFIVLKKIKRSVVKLGLVETALKDFWESRGLNKIGKRDNYHFIAEIIEAESGTVIFSEEKDNKVVITGKNNVPLTSLAAIGDGKVEYVSNSKSTLEIISDTPIQPLYTAVKFKSNGHFEIVG
jgi:hypothetical protein